MEKLKVSLCVVTHNSEERIGKMLRMHRDVVDEILVIDQSSTDNTRVEAEKYADRVITRRCKGASDPDRNWLYAQARNPWVLYLDDDEYLDHNTIKRLPVLLAQDKIHIYWLKHKNLVNGIDIKELSGDDWHPRLFRKGSMRYLDQQTSVDHTYPEAATGTNVAHVNYFIVHDRTLEKIKKANRDRNRVATPEQINLQENYIAAVEKLLAKKKEEKINK